MKVVTKGGAVEETVSLNQGHVALGLINVNGSEFSLSID